MLVTLKQQAFTYLVDETYDSLQDLINLLFLAIPLINSKHLQP